MIRNSTLILLATLAVSASRETRAGFVYTTSIDYDGNAMGNVSSAGTDLGSINAKDFGNQMFYTQSAMTTQTAITGSSQVKIGGQTVTYLGNSAFFDTIGHVSYNLVITNTATQASRKIKIGVGTVGTVGEPGPMGEGPALTLSTTQVASQGQPDVLTATLDGVDFSVDLSQSHLPSILGIHYLVPTGQIDPNGNPVLALPRDMPISVDFTVQLNVVGLVVPEPASLTLVSIGALGLVASASARRARAVRRSA